jgi:outer membrane biogenesis lipoprotein LolB
MMKRNLTPLLIAIASSYLLVGCCTTTQHATPKMEYLTRWNASDAQINELADQGWTVVNIAGTENGKWFLLKRPKQ